MTLGKHRQYDGVMFDDDWSSRRVPLIFNVTAIYGDGMRRKERGGKREERGEEARMKEKEFKDMRRLGKKRRRNAK